MTNNYTKFEEEIKNHKEKYDCSHENVYPAIYVYSNGTKHIYEICSICGKRLNSVLSRNTLKEKYNLEKSSLKKFDPLTNKKWIEKLNKEARAIYTKHEKTESGEYEEAGCKIYTRDEIKQYTRDQSL